METEREKLNTVMMHCTLVLLPPTDFGPGHLSFDPTEGALVSVIISDHSFAFVLDVDFLDILAESSGVFRLLLLPLGHRKQDVAVIKPPYKQNKLMMQTT